MSETAKHRIPYALLCNFNWRYGEHSGSLLIASSKEVTPEEYDQSMMGRLYCPECKTPINRSPRKTLVMSNSRTAHFRHLPSYSHVLCNLRTSKPKGKRFINEEIVYQAEEKEDLVTVNSWAKEPPLGDEFETRGEYGQTQIEDSKGEETEEPIGRHSGDSFDTPRNIETVAAICTNFDKNLNVGYFLPNSQHSGLLKDLLFDVSRLDEGCSRSARLFFGRIYDYRTLTNRNVIELIVRDDPRLIFRLYTYPYNDERKRLDIDIRQRYIIFHSDFYHERNGFLACKLDEWGQYSILPDKYIERIESVSHQN